MAKKLKGLGVATVSDLLFYFPFRYDDFSKTTLVRDLRVGEAANIVGRIEFIQTKRSPRRRMHITEALVSDETESVKAIWFNQPFIGKVLCAGDYVSLSGKVEKDYGGPVLISPEYEKVSFVGGNTNVHTQGLVPAYHLTANLTHKQLRFLIKSVIHLAAALDDWLPAEIIRELKLMPLAAAVEKIHFPKTPADIDKAKKRLGFNEVFLLQMRSQMIRRAAAMAAAAPIAFREKETKAFVGSLPFKLTDDQRRAAWEIIRDIGGVRPMARLLEGDVGSGKTVVALMAMLNVAWNGYQSVLLAPTEILARQHYELIRKLAGNQAPICLLTRSQSLMSQAATDQKMTKAEVLKTVRRAACRIIIGTHALLEEKVEFDSLSLAVIDEQHRFGVEQRALLTRTKSVKVRAYSPHLLSMTATPIPRSLALALYGDLDLSIIKEMPAGRKKIITSVIPETKREQAYGFIREKIREGRQAFVICPLIDASDKLGVKSVREEFEKLDKRVFPDLKMGMLHGRLKAADKEAVMREFLENKTKILVATSVVEVGVDVPNAAIMMIEGADRFGLAQLHQFRGRVGRSEHQSYCFFFTDSSSEKTLERLKAMTVYNDGFSLAKIDLKLRGPGEVYGTIQKGFPELKVVSLFDYEIMKTAREQAEKILAKDESLASWPALCQILEEKKEVVHLE